MYEAAGESRNAAARPNSSGSPYRPSGIPSLAFRRCSSTETPSATARDRSSERTRAVSKRPGARLLTLMRGPSSSARHLASATTPGRSTFEASRFSIGWRTEDEVTNRTEAPSFIRGTSAQQPHRPAYQEPEGVEPLLVR